MILYGALDFSSAAVRDTVQRLAELLNNWHPETRLLYSDLRAAACGDAIGPPTGHRLLCQTFTVASVPTPSSSGRAGAPREARRSVQPADLTPAIGCFIPPHPLKYAVCRLPHLSPLDRDLSLDLDGSSDPTSPLAFAGLLAVAI